MKGSCNCKELQFEALNEIKAIVNCHCKLCRKMNGSAFSTYVVVSAQDFELKQGSLQTVQVSSDASKSVCRSCLTPIFNQNPKLAGLIILYLGSIDNMPSTVPTINIYCESQLDWVGEISSLANMEKGMF